MPTEEQTLDDFLSQEIAAHQTKRTTFTLSLEALDALKWLQEIIDGSPRDVVNAIASSEKLARIDATKLKKTRASTNVARKTVVVLERVLENLNDYSQNTHIKRDVLVENLLFAAMERVKIRDQRRYEYYKEVLPTLNELRNDFGKHDENIGKSIDKIIATVETELENEEPTA